jgi:hypothetical protein
MSELREGQPPRRGLGHHIAAVATALVGGAVLLVVVLDAHSRSSAGGGSRDLAWALLFACGPAAATLLAGVAGIIAALVRDRALGRLGLASGLALVPANLIGGGVGMITASANDSKWACVVAGIAGMIAAALLAGGGWRSRGSP